MEISLNQQKKQPVFDDKAMMNDALISQKTLTQEYNTFANEAVTPSVRNEFLSILSEEHQIGADLFDAMNQRGWYQVPPADQMKIDKAKQKFIK